MGAAPGDRHAGSPGAAAQPAAHDRPGVSAPRTRPALCRAVAPCPNTNFIALRQHACNIGPRARSLAALLVKPRPPPCQRGARPALSAGRWPRRDRRGPGSRAPARPASPAGSPCPAATPCPAGSPCSAGSPCRTCRPSSWPARAGEPATAQRDARSARLPGLGPQHLSTGRSSAPS